jgi:hypothetical protein
MHGKTTIKDPVSLNLRDEKSGEERRKREAQGMRPSPVLWHEI